MKVNVEEINSVARRLSVAVPAQEVDKTIDKLYKKLKKSAKLKGFRPGKAPMSVLEKFYGPQVAAEAMEALIGENYTAALDEAKLEPVAQPTLEPSGGFPTKGEDFTFSLTLDVKPEFELDKATYLGLTLKEPDLKVTDEVIGERLTALLERQAKTVPVSETRPARTGDVVVINYESFDGEAPLEGGQADNFEVVLGSGRVAEEIEVVLVGSKPGDMLETTVHYDENANQKLANKDIKFKIFVKEIKEKQLPKADDEFARSLGGDFDTIDALKDRIKEDLEKYHAQQKDMEVRRQILDAIRDLGEFDIPQSLVEKEAEDMVESFKQRLKQSGMDPDMAGLDSEKMKEDFKAEAERKVRAGIVLGRITELEEVDVEDADLDAEFAKMAESTGQSAEVLKDFYRKNNMMSNLAARCLEEKTLQVIKAGATIEAVDPAELAGQGQA